MVARHMETLFGYVLLGIISNLRLSPWLRQTVKALFAVRCEFIVPHPGTVGCRVVLPVKRRRALLASNPIEEWPAGTHRGR